MSKIAVIGAGFSGLSAAAYLSAAGLEVDVYEKNATAGGRARQLTTPAGYVFDMGPSWYWMPDVFDRFFQDFGLSAADGYDLTLLDPSFEVVFDKGEKVEVPSSYAKLKELFETIEPGSAGRLDRFMEDARRKYVTAMEDLVYMPGLSIREFADPGIIREASRLRLFASFSKHVRRYFSNPKLLALMEFPVLFLGAMPQETPALYSLMNYAGLKLGTWYPQGGFGKVVDFMKAIAESQGTVFHFEAPVQKIVTSHNLVNGIIVNGEYKPLDAVIGSADYHHIESDLLEKSERNYTDRYWNRKTFAPSCLIFFLGVSRKLPSLQHHTLFFEEDLFQHSLEIYKSPEWPSAPLFYACCPSRTDATVAPEGHENLFLLMPVAPGLRDDETVREKYFRIMMDRLEKHAGVKIAECIDHKTSYCINDFIDDYHACKGNAYGLANTLMQTAFMKPKIRNKRIHNLFYAGQLTVPGPGVPPSLISGKIAASQLIKYLKNNKHETAV